MIFQLVDGTGWNIRDLDKVHD